MASGFNKRKSVGGSLPTALWKLSQILFASSFADGLNVKGAFLKDK